MGLSNERMREIMAMEYEMEGDSSRRHFHNFQYCKFSNCCPAMGFRLKMMPRKDVEHCYDNPGILECKMYKFFGGAAKEYGLSDAPCDSDGFARFNDDMTALCVDIEENGWK